MHRKFPLLFFILFVSAGTLSPATATPSPTPSIASPTPTPSAPTSTPSPAAPTWTAAPSQTAATGTPAASPTMTPGSTGTPPTATATPPPVLPAPELMEPSDDARFGESTEPFEFDWSDVAGAVRYEIELAADPDFEMTTGPIEAADSAFDLADFDIDPYLWETTSLTIHWRARAVGLTTTGEWSAPRVVHKSVFEEAEILSPYDGTRYTTGDRLPDFEWSVIEGIEYYEMEFALDADFSEPLPRVILYTNYLDLSITESSAWDAYVGMLYWRVAGVDSSDVHGPWSEPVWFSKTTLDPPDVTFPDAESNFASQSDPIDFTWVDDDDAGSWELQLSMTDDFMDPFDPIPCEDPSLLLSTMVEPEVWWTVYGTFYWRVAAVTDNGIPGPWCAPRRFTKIGRHRFLAWGDSITAGECVDNGYCDMILPELRDRFADAVIVNRAVPGTKSAYGAANIEEEIRETCPEFALILFGDNDTVDPGNCVPPNDCRVDDHVQEMIDICQEYNTTPIVSTVLPINPISRFAYRQESASEWSQAIRNVVGANGAVLADQEEYFFAYPNMPALYCYYGDPDYIDWVHPNETGYQIMINCYIDAIDDMLDS